MPHGDFSDMAALVTLGAGLTAIWAPQYYYTDVGPMKAFFEGGDEAMSPNEATLLNLVGASLIFIFWALYSVRWNTVNGKAAAVGTATLATTCGRIAWKMDGGELVFRGWHVLMVLYVGTIVLNRISIFRPPSQFKYIYMCRPDPFLPDGLYLLRRVGRVNQPLINRDTFWRTSAPSLIIGERTFIPSRTSREYIE